MRNEMRMDSNAREKRYKRRLYILARVDEKKRIIRGTKSDIVTESMTKKVTIYHTKTREIHRIISIM